MATHGWSKYFSQAIRLAAHFEPVTETDKLVEQAKKRGDALEVRKDPLEELDTLLEIGESSSEILDGLRGLALLAKGLVFLERNIERRFKQPTAGKPNLTRDEALEAILVEMRADFRPMENAYKKRRATGFGTRDSMRGMLDSLVVRMKKREEIRMGVIVQKGAIALISEEDCSECSGEKEGSNSSNSSKPDICSKCHGRGKIFRNLSPTEAEELGVTIHFR